MDGVVEIKTLRVIKRTNPLSTMDLTMCRTHHVGTQRMGMKRERRHSAVLPANLPDYPISRIPTRPARGGGERWGRGTERETSTVPTFWCCATREDSSKA